MIITNMRIFHIVLILTMFAVFFITSIYRFVKEIDWLDYSQNQKNIGAFYVFGKKNSFEEFLSSFTNEGKIKYNNLERIKYDALQPSTVCRDCIKTTEIVEVVKNNSNSKSILQKRRIWISMALCFSKNTHMYKKKNYPYVQVTPLAIILWYHFFPDIQIVLYLVYDEYESKDRQTLYEEQLKQTNVEIRWVKEGDMDCVTKSQLIRMWAFQEPMIQEDDIIVTVDVNLFVASPKILNPIYENRHKKVWVFMWYDTSFIESGIGETFNQNLMSAESNGIFLNGTFLKK